MSTGTGCSFRSRGAAWLGGVAGRCGWAAQLYLLPLSMLREVLTSDSFWVTRWARVVLCSTSERCWCLYADYVVYTNVRLPGVSGTSCLRVA